MVLYKAFLHMDVHKRGKITAAQLEKILTQRFFDAKQCCLGVLISYDIVKLCR